MGLSTTVGYAKRVLSGIRIPELKKSLALARVRSGKNRAWLFFDMLQCAARYGAGYHDYVMFAFYNMNHAHRKTYVTRFKNKKLISLVNDADAADEFDQKSLFYSRFKDYLGREFFLPQTMTEEDFSAFVQGKETLFAKPDVGESGKGIEKLKVADFEDIHTLYAYIQEKNFGVVEEELSQHEAVKKLYPLSINSLRVVTLVTGNKIREANCVYAVIKMGNGGKFVDNLENGGMFCPLDLETGVITGVAHTSALTNFSTHPYTGITLEGYHIPYVKEAVELCKKAALIEPKMRFLGWDVCITPTGPAIIEGNDYPGYDFWQQPEHTPDQIGLWPYYLKMVPGLSKPKNQQSGEAVWA